jgi:hypothetical protein
MQLPYKEQLTKKPETKETDREGDIIPGVVSLKKLEVQGVSVNLAEIF